MTACLCGGNMLGEKYSPASDEMRASKMAPRMREEVSRICESAYGDFKRRRRNVARISRQLFMAGLYWRLRFEKRHRD